MVTEKILFSRLLIIIHHLFPDFEQAIVLFCYFGFALLFFSNCVPSPSSPPPYFLFFSKNFRFFMTLSNISYWGIANQRTLVGHNWENLFSI